MTCRKSTLPEEENSSSNGWNDEPESSPALSPPLPNRFRGHDLGKMGLSPSYRDPRVQGLEEEDNGDDGDDIDGNDNKDNGYCSDSGSKGGSSNSDGGEVTFVPPPKCCCLN